MHFLITFKSLFHWTLSSIYKDDQNVSFFNSVSKYYLVSAEFLMTLLSGTC